MKKIFETLTMVALLIWGAVFLYFYFSGRVDYLLAERFRIGVPIAGIGMILLGGLNLILRNRSAEACAHDHAHGDHSHCDHDHHDEHDHGEECDHDHSHDHSHADHHHHDEATASSLAFALFILLVPLLVSARFTPKSFSGDYVKKWDKIEQDMQQLRQRKAAATTQQMAATENPYNNPEDSPKAEDSNSSGGGEAWGEFTLEDLKKMVPQTTVGDFLLDVPQIFYTAGDQELMNVMEGISVQTTAQVIEDTAENSSGNRLRAYRLLIECCAADARPLSIPIDFTEAAPEYKEMGWYKLIGRLHFHKNGDHEYIPILQIKKFEATPEPADWMSIY